jgi:DNA-binding transcriptional regulator YbjK
MPGPRRRRNSKPPAWRSIVSERTGIVSFIDADLQRSRREQILIDELYPLAARRDEFRIITQSWMRASRHALERPVAPGTERALDAHVEDAALDISLDPDPQPAAQTREAITGFIGPSGDQGGPREENR